MKGVGVNNYAGTTGKTHTCSGKTRTYTNLFRAFQDSSDQIGFNCERALVTRAFCLLHTRYQCELISIEVVSNGLKKSCTW